MAGTEHTILIIVARYLCYASNECFALKLANALTELGQSVEICNLISREDAEIQLGQYVHKPYLAVIDFNSTLPRAKVGEQYFPDCLDAPFYDYIVDHPLYHHPILSLPVHNLNVICIDQTHVSYLHQYYPKIAHVIFLPLAGCRALTQIPFRSKFPGVLFTGTYYSPQKYYNLIKDQSSLEQKEIFEMAEILCEGWKQDPGITPEDALKQVCSIDSPTEFRRTLNHYFLADIYARAIMREQIVLSFASAEVPMIICGNEWEKSPLSEYPNITLKPGVDYQQIIEMIASAQILLNVLPGFVEGIHDRVFLALCNNTVLLSDSNSYIREELQDTKDCFLFEHKNTAAMAQRVQELLHCTSILESVAHLGQEHCSQNHTWHHRAITLLQELHSIRP